MRAENSGMQEPFELEFNFSTCQDVRMVAGHFTTFMGTLILLSRDVPRLSSLCFELLDFLDELLLALQRLKQHKGMRIQKLE